MNLFGKAPLERSFSKYCKLENFEEKILVEGRSFKKRQVCHRDNRWFESIQKRLVPKNYKIPDKLQIELGGRYVCNDIHRFFEPVNIFVLEPLKRSTEEIAKKQKLQKKVQQQLQRQLTQRSNQG